MQFTDTQQDLFEQIRNRNKDFRQNIRDLISEFEGNGTRLSNGADQRELLMEISRCAHHERRIFSPLLLIARHIYQRFPSLVTQKDCPGGYAEAFKEWAELEDTQYENLRELLRECAWLLPDQEFDEYVREWATDMVLDAKAVTAHRAAEEVQIVL